MSQRTERTVSTLPDDVRVRIYNASARTEKTALIYLHGGDWTTISIDTPDRLMREYAARADIVVICVDHALSPEVKFPVAREQIAAVARWAHQHSAALAFSAGGNLAITTASRLRDEGAAEAVHAIVTNYAVANIYSAPEALQRYGYEGYMLGADEMIKFSENYLSSPEHAKNPPCARACELARTAASVHGHSRM